MSKINYLPLIRSIDRTGKLIYSPDGIKGYKITVQQLYDKIKPYLGRSSNNNYDDEAMSEDDNDKTEGVKSYTPERYWIADYDTENECCLLYANYPIDENKDAQSGLYILNEHYNTNYSREQILSDTVDGFWAPILESGDLINKINEYYDDYYFNKHGNQSIVDQDEIDRIAMIFGDKHFMDSVQIAGVSAQPMTIEQAFPWISYDFLNNKITEWRNSDPDDPKITALSAWMLQHKTELDNAQKILKWRVFANLCLAETGRVPYLQIGRYTDGYTVERAQVVEQYGWDIYYRRDPQTEEIILIDYTASKIIDNNIEHWGTESDPYYVLCGNNEDYSYVSGYIHLNFPEIYSYCPYFTGLFNYLISEYGVSDIVPGLPAEVSFLFDFDIYSYTRGYHFSFNHPTPLSSDYSYGRTHIGEIKSLLFSELIGATTTNDFDPEFVSKPYMYYQYGQETINRASSYLVGDSSSNWHGRIQTVDPGNNNLTYGKKKYPFPQAPDITYGNDPVDISNIALRANMTSLYTNNYIAIDSPGCIESKIIKFSRFLLSGSGWTWDHIDISGVFPKLPYIQLQNHNIHIGEMPYEQFLMRYCLGDTGDPYITSFQINDTEMTHRDLQDEGALYVDWTILNAGGIIFGKRNNNWTLWVSDSIMSQYPALEFEHGYIDEETGELVAEGMVRDIKVNGVSVLDTETGEANIDFEHQETINELQMTGSEYNYGELGSGYLPEVHEFDEQGNYHMYRQYAMNMSYYGLTGSSYSQDAVVDHNVNTYGPESYCPYYTGSCNGYYTYQSVVLIFKVTIYSPVDAVFTYYVKDSSESSSYRPFDPNDPSYDPTFTDFDTAEVLADVPTTLQVVKVVEATDPRTGSYSYKNFDGYIIHNISDEVYEEQHEEWSHDILGYRSVTKVHLINCDNPVPQPQEG